MPVVLMTDFLERVGRAEVAGVETLPRVAVAGIPFVITSMEAITTWVIRSAGSTDSLPIRLANAHCVVETRKDKFYAEILKGGGLTLPDGASVSWMMRR